MKKCPFCAEEIQDEAIVCRYCDRELVPLQSASRPILQPIAQSPPSAPQPAAQPPPNIPVNPELSLAMQKYTKAGYKVISASGDVVNLERPATKLNQPLSLVLFLFTFLGLFIYLAIYFIWMKRKAYNVQLTIGPDGQVQELGNTIEVFERDSLQANQKRCIGFGIFFGIFLGGLVVLFSILALVIPSDDFKTLGERIGLAIFFLVLFGLPTIGLGAFLLWRAKKIKEKLNINEI